MNDMLIRGLAGDGNVRFFAVDSTAILKKAVSLHHLSITNAVIMGRLMSAALMMGLDLKNDNDLITLIIEGDGPVGKVLVTAGNKGAVKGYINNPELETPYDEKENRFGVKQALGNGVIKIIKNIGLKTPYQGQVELKYGTIARDLTYYFSSSEQIPSSMGLGVLIGSRGEVVKSGGFLVQLLPQTPEEVISKLEKNLETFPNLTDVMDMGHTIAHIMTNFILADLHVEIKDTMPAVYRCDCSREKFSRGLQLLGKKELTAALQQEEKITVQCHFCNQLYEYSKNELEAILEKL